MYILMVRLKVKEDRIEDFITASIGDAEGSVMNEPGCRRFDIIQAANDPTSFAFCEVYNDEAAFEDHNTYPHFKKWDAAVKDMFSEPVEVSFCKPVFPRGDASWDSYRSGRPSGDPGRPSGPSGPPRSSARPSAAPLPRQRRLPRYPQPYCSGRRRC